MLDVFMQLGLFTAKSIIVFLIIVTTLVAVLAIIAKSKEKMRERLSINSLNEKYEENTDTILSETLSKKDYKKFQKEKKEQSKQAKKDEKKKSVFVISFDGDVKASAVSCLREEITAILNVAKETDEVILKLESPGGMVHAYGLAAAQLIRLREKNIPLTVAIDKVAASGGYMMACIANKIIAAPFSIIGSIGVIVQFPNFNRFMKDKHIDFEQHTAGKFKRTITLFGENTDEGRQKLQGEIEIIHTLFKDLIKEHRPQLDIEAVATGEHWLAKQAIEMDLIDHIQTSDDYLLDRAKEANLYELNYHIKQPLANRLMASSNLMVKRLLNWFTQPGAL